MVSGFSVSMSDFQPTRNALVVFTGPVAPPDDGVVFVVCGEHAASAPGTATIAEPKSAARSNVRRLSPW